MAGTSPAMTAQPIRPGFSLLVCFDPAALWYDGAMNHIKPEKPVSESIAASLARSEAQIAAGQTVPLEPVLDRLRASIAQTDNARRGSVLRQT